MVQYREDEQTHLLPRDAQRHSALAQAMGMETRVFATTLGVHRTFVARAFRNAFRIAGMGDPEGKQAVSATPSAKPAGRIPAPYGEPPEPVPRHIHALLETHREHTQPRPSRTRIQAPIRATTPHAP